MIPHEVLYSVLGVVAALIAGRLGIPLPGLPKPSLPQGTLLQTAVRAALLEVLRAISNPQPDEGGEIRQHLQALVNPGKPVEG
jgi:hypothetical protein